MKRLLLLALGCAAVLSGCEHTATEQPEARLDSNPRRFALVVKSTENPYMACMYEGFRDACVELGDVPLLVGPDANGEPGQAELIHELIAQGVDAIAVAANDKNALSAELNDAIAADIPVVSLDSMVNPESRLVHVQQASPEMVGRVLIQAGAEMMGFQGQFAILSTTATMPNQASWVRWMRHELEAYPEKYKAIQLVEVAYGMDAYETSAELTRALLERYPDLRLIIAPTVVGIRAAAEEIQRQGSSVKVTGLGLPSDMESYIRNGVCPWMYLWNPSEVGYLAAYAADALVDGNLAGTVGEPLAAGRLGVRVVTGCEDGGTEIVVGNPIMFDSTNIIVWKDIF